MQIKYQTLHIIAGAFSTERNANKLVRKLKRWNFDNARIIGQSNSGLFRVCYDGFVKPEDALITLDDQEDQHFCLASFNVKNMASKTPSESIATLTEMVLPNDTNNLDNLMGEDYYTGWILPLLLLLCHCGKLLLPPLLTMCLSINQFPEVVL